MLSKSKIKLIHSLEQKKFRRSEQAFVAEGHKSVGDLLREGFHARLLVATDEWASPIPLTPQTDLVRVSDDELRRASLLQHPQQVIGVFTLPGLASTLPGHASTPPAAHAPQQLLLALDGVQDPGNLGTIIRTADWFGVRHIICSPQTADAYAPKTVQATMGSIARVHVSYTDLPAWIAQLPHGTPIYGTMLDGDSLYSTPLQAHGVVVMGNEGNGISDDVARLLTHRLLIPPYPTDNRTAESLNVSIATAIILAEMRRNS